MENKDIVVLVNGVPLPVDDFEQVVGFISNLTQKNNKEYHKWLDEVKEDGFNLRFVPEELKTKEMCELAVKDEALTLQYVPEELRTYKLCYVAIKNDGTTLEFVPEELRTFEICNKAIFTILRDEWDVDLDESFEGFFERNVPEEMQEELAGKYNIELSNKSKGR